MRFMVRRRRDATQLTCVRVCVRACVVLFESRFLPLLFSLYARGASITTSGVNVVSAAAVDESLAL